MRAQTACDTTKAEAVASEIKPPDYVPGTVLGTSDKNLAVGSIWVQALATKVCLVKAMIFPVVMCACTDDVAVRALITCLSGSDQ